MKEELVEGTITKIVHKGDNLGLVFAEYKVLGKSYQISESVKYKVEPIKLGFLPIGTRKIPRMGTVSVGDSVRIAYNPQQPDRAYLVDNRGFING